MFREERFADVWPELEPYWEANWRETREEGDDRPLVVNLEDYLLADEIGRLKTLVARTDEGKAVGYFLVIFGKNPKSEGMIGTAESYYLAPEHRGQDGLRLMREAERMMRYHGATHLYVGTKKHGKLLERLGYAVSEVTYSRKL